jgi:hypothetical protein
MRPKEPAMIVIFFEALKSLLGWYFQHPIYLGLALLGMSLVIWGVDLWLPELEGAEEVSEES